MSDLYDLLAAHFVEADPATAASAPPRPNDPQTTSYLNRLSTLSLSDLTSTEPASLLHAAQSHARNLQALSKRSHKAVIASSSHLANLTSLLPSLATQVTELKNAVPELETAASSFAQKYDRSTENAVLGRRTRAMLLNRNVERVTDVLELPSLLSSIIAAAQAPNAGSGSNSNASTSYASALDLHAHIQRLSSLYPESTLVSDISQQAEAEIENLTSVLISSLQNPQLKLAAAMRTIGWLRRVAPDLADDGHDRAKPTLTSWKTLDVSASAVNTEGALGSLFLVCRLRTLHQTLAALEPLRDLADQETARRSQQANGTLLKAKQQEKAFGTQSERYLKRYLEIYREQSFAIISVYKSIFPSGLPSADVDQAGVEPVGHNSRLSQLPSPLATFTQHLVQVLQSTLNKYLPNIIDSSTRDSILTQVLYCAGSLGRLGAGFGMMIALLEEATSGEVAKGPEPEWISVMKKHRIQASRLEVLARGVGSGRKTSADQSSPIATPVG